MTKLIIGILTIVVLAVATYVYLLQQEAPVQTVNGTVRYNERMALPPGSLLTVELRDVTRGDAEVVTLDRYEYTTAGENVPLPFTLNYEPAKLADDGRYVLFAEIQVDGQVRFTTVNQYPIDKTKGSVGIDVLLVQTSPEEYQGTGSADEVGGNGKKPPSPSPLAGTAWVWRETAYSGKRTVPDNDDFVLSFTETEVRSTTDCNRLGGTYIVADSNITFSPFEMTEMYCEGSLEAVYAADLAKALQFRIEGTALTIDIGGESQMRFMATEPVAEDSVPTGEPDTPVSSSDEVGIEVDAETSVDGVSLE